MAYGRYSKSTPKGGGGIRSTAKKSETPVFLISILLPDGKVKEFRTDELNEQKTLARFHERYGESNLIVTRTQIDSMTPKEVEAKQVAETEDTYAEVKEG